MERHFILPATIAAALHAGLLFGSHRTPAEVIRNHPGPTPPTLCGLTVDDFFPPPDETDQKDSSSASSASSERSVTLVEHLVAPTSDAFVFEKVRTESGPSIDPGRISVGPPGLGDNIGPVGPRVVSLTELDGVPRARVQPSPAYPPEARQTGLNGEVVVEFTVDETGAVVDPRAIRSTARVFEEPALRAVARWRFEPGLRGGHPVRFRMAVPIVFRLDET
jgi:protein TonB